MEKCARGILETKFLPVENFLKLHRACLVSARLLKGKKILSLVAPEKK